jgi:hypothetical protein
VQLASFELFNVTWNQFVQSLGNGEQGPKWDIMEARKGGDELIVDSYAPDDPLLPAMRDAEKNGTLPLHTKNLTDDQIRALCDRRAIIQNRERAGGLCEKDKRDCISLCAPSSAGAVAEQFFGLRERHFREYLQRAAESAKTADPFRIFVYSHTHIAEPPILWSVSTIRGM